MQWLMNIPNNMDKVAGKERPFGSGYIDVARYNFDGVVDNIDRLQCGLGVVNIWESAVLHVRSILNG